MKLSDLSDKNTARVKFACFFAAAVFLCVVIFSSFWTPSHLKPGTESRSMQREDLTGNDQLLGIEGLLHTQWMQLENLYDTHAVTLLETSANAAVVEGSNKILMEEEVTYAKVLDSVSIKNATSPVVVKIDSIVNSFRTMLQQKQALNNRLAALASAKTNQGSSANTKDANSQLEKLSKLEKDVQDKSLLISQLEARLSAVPAKNINTTEDNPQLRKMEKDLQSKNAMISKLELQLKAVPQASGASAQSPAAVKKMKDEIEFLKWALRSEVSSNHALTNSVNQLKQTNANLTKELKKN